jgi:flavin-dependent dehydrogenase
MQAEVKDVAVIGGGPAGCAVAALLASRGVRVELVGPPPPFDRGHRACQTLGPQGIRSVLKLGVPIDVLDATCRTLEGFATSWGAFDSVRGSSLSLSMQEFRIITRAAFDEVLAVNAEKCGATRVRDTVLDAVLEGTLWTLRLRKGPLLRARLIVDATGRAGRFVRHHGATLTAVDELLVWSVKCEVPHRPPVVEIDATERGWVFSAPIVAGERIVAFFGDKDLLTPRTGGSLRLSWPREVQRSQLWSKYAEQVGSCTVTVEAATTGYVDHAVLPGLVAIGDAAQTVDPLSSQGIVSALLDAESAAEAIAGALGGDLERLCRHEAQRRGRFCRYLLERQAQYGVETRFETSPFWRRRQQPIDESWHPRWAAA